MTEPLTYSVDEAATRLGVGRDWLAREAAAGRVPSRKIGSRRRFTDADLAEYLETCRDGAAKSIAGTSLSRSRRRSA